MIPVQRETVTLSSAKGLACQLARFFASAQNDKTMVTYFAGGAA